jgi:DNA-directed RNA polymerase beta subunit
VKEKKGKLKIVIDLIERLEKDLVVKFYCEGEKKASFCELPKITSTGNFIINGHDKVVIFQSVRAPSLYFFTSENNEKVYGEIIPIKGP